MPTSIATGSNACTPYLTMARRFMFRPKQCGATQSPWMEKEYLASLNLMIPRTKRVSTLVAITPVPFSMTPRSSVGGRTTTVNSVSARFRTPTTPTSINLYDYGPHSRGSMATAFSTVCALLDDGSVKCWGRDNYGQLGDGSGIASTNSPPSSSINLGNHTAKAITGGEFHFCAILDDDSIMCWGRTVLEGQLGSGGTGGSLYDLGLHRRRDHWAQGATPSPLMLATTIHALFSITAT